MAKRRAQSNSSAPKLASGGGNATTAGVEFQSKLGAWFAAHLLAERPLEPRLTGQLAKSLRCETEAPVDDLLIETARGWVFVQAKTNISLSQSPTSDLAKALEQVVRLWLTCKNGNGSLGWNRPLSAGQDCILLAVGPRSSKVLSEDLAEALTALRLPGAQLSRSKSESVKSFSELLARIWEATTGRQSTPAEIQEISQLITVAKFDFDGPDRLVAVELIAQVVSKSADASAAFSVSTQYVQSLMRLRSGCDMLMLRQALQAHGVALAEPPSFRADIEKLRKYSQHIHIQLSDYESTKIADSEIPIERECTPAVVNAASTGSVLLVGEPGAGKSAVMSASASLLRTAGFDVVELAVDRLPVRSLPELATELGLSHPLREVLLNWPGDRPALLFVDALDATRGGENEGIFRALIEDVLSIKNRRWHVIASIRTFDLRMGHQFRDLFRGQPPAKQFADVAFKDVVHVHVGNWTPKELSELLAAAPKLATALHVGGERISELARVPFNSRLVADLINGGMDAKAFGEITSQVQLLALYWNRRVEQYGTGAELCLEAAVAEMVKTRSLRANKLETARPDVKAFDKLLHENVLVSRSDTYIAFRHHLLFDYAASRVYLRLTDLPRAVTLLSRQNGVGLMLAPALGFALQQAWTDEDTPHTHFWTVIVSLVGNSECDPIARSVGARAAAELPQKTGDARALSDNLSSSTTDKKARVAALAHVVGALAVRVEDKQPVSLDPWCDLAHEASGYIQDTAGPLRVLLFLLQGHVASDSQRKAFGRAARNLLTYSLDSKRAASLTPSAIGFVANSYASDPTASKQLLQRLFVPDHFEQNADQEIPWLVRGLQSISNVDPEFVVQIYGYTFGRQIIDSSKTQLGASQILPLSSNRRQDYEHSWWELGQFFPKFLRAHPIHAVRALIHAISGYADRDHPVSEARIWKLSTPVGDVSLRADFSHLWAWNINEEHGNSALGLVKEYVNYFQAADDGMARSLIMEIVAGNELALLWSRTFMATLGRAGVLGDLLWPIATTQAFILCDETRKDAIDFVAARYPFETNDSRASFEKAALTFDFSNFNKPDEAHKHVLSTLFGTIGRDNLATDNARGFIGRDDAKQAEAEALNTRPFSIVTSSGAPEQWWWLKREGVDLEATDVKEVLTRTEEIKDRLQIDGAKEQQGIDINSALLDLTDLIATVESRDTSNLGAVSEYAHGVVAQGVAKLASLPVERLRENRQTHLSLTDFAIQLAKKLPSGPRDAESEARFESSAAWGSPNIAVSIAEALINLCRIDSETVTRLRPTLENLLQSSVPPARMQIADHLTALWETGRPLMWELAERVAHTETNRGVLRFFANYVLGRTVHADPERVENLLFVLHGREFGSTDEPTKHVHEEVGSLISLLWISHGRERSRVALQTWINEAVRFEPELWHAIFMSRGALALKYQTGSLTDVPITDRAQAFCGWAVSAMAAGLENYLNDVQKKTPTDDEKKVGTLYAKLLNHLCDQIYFASGAFRSNDGEAEPLKSLEAKRAFLGEMRPILTRIAEAGTPGTIHHLVELLSFLAPADHATAFDLVALALLGAGRRHHYQFESLGADRFVEIIGYYLADHRELFNDSTRRQKLVECLNIFMEAGWPAARRLLYRLPELLQ